MDENTRFILGILGLTLGGASLYLYRRTVPHYLFTEAEPTPKESFLTTPPRIFQKGIRNSIWRFFTFLAVLSLALGLLVLVGAIMTTQGQPLPPAQMIQDARSGAWVGGLTLLILGPALFLTRRRGGFLLRGGDAKGLKASLDEWLRTVAPGLQDGGSRLPLSVYAKESSEWALLVVDETPSRADKPMQASFTCSAATVPTPQLSTMTLMARDKSGIASGLFCWNITLTEAGSHEATLQLHHPANERPFRHNFRVLSVLGRSARELRWAAAVGWIVGLLAEIVALVR